MSGRRACGLPPEIKRPADIAVAGQSGMPILCILLANPHLASASSLPGSDANIIWTSRDRVSRAPHEFVLRKCAAPHSARARSRWLTHGRAISGKARALASYSANGRLRSGSGFTRRPAAPSSGCVPAPGGLLAFLPFARTRRRARCRLAPDDRTRACESAPPTCSFT